MMKNLIAAVLLAVGLSATPARAASIDCTQLTTGLRLCIPKYGTAFDNWARADIAVFNLINSSAVFASTSGSVNLGTIYTNKIGALTSAGIQISSYTWHTSSMTVAGGGGLAITYGVNAATAVFSSMSVPTVTSSMTVKGAGGLSVTYAISAGSAAFSSGITASSMTANGNIGLTGVLTGPSAFQIAAAGSLRFLINGTEKFYFSETESRIASDLFLGFNSATNITGTNDVSLSRVSVGVLGVGSGAAGSVAGTIVAAKMGVGKSTVTATTFDVEGNAQFGSGVTKSTFSTTGALTIANGALITASAASIPTITSSLTITNASGLSGPSAFDINAGASIRLAIAGTEKMYFGVGDVRLASDMNLGFNSATNITGTTDVDLSRISVGVLGVGSGAVGSVAGTIVAAKMAVGASTAIATAFEVVGDAQFGSGVSKATMTAAGGLQLPYGLSASTAVVTYAQVSSITVSGIPITNSGSYLFINAPNGIKGAATLQLDTNGAGSIRLLQNGTMKIYMDGSSTRLASDYGWYWNTATNASGSNDVGLSRISIGVLGVGSGAQGSSAGTVVAAKIGVNLSTVTNSQLEGLSNSSPSGYAISFASQTAVVASLFGVTGGGHVVSSGTTPGIACNAGSPVMLADSNDMSGEFTGGAASINCTVTFATAFSKKPRCWAQDGTSNITPKVVTTTTNMVISATLIGTDAIMYGCQAAP